MNKLINIIKNPNSSTIKTARKYQAIINKMSNKELLQFILDNDICILEVNDFLELNLY